MKKMRCLVSLVMVGLVGLAAVPALANGPIILDFEDLENTNGSYHTMLAHNPYHEVVFSGPYGPYTLNHRDNADYAAPHSGNVYLFNSYGYDGLYISFSEPVLFDGIWAGYPIYSVMPPENRAKELWLEGYLGAAKVGESARITLGATMQWCPANFGGAVDKVVFRRSTQNGQSNIVNAFYTLDDATFRKLTAPMLIDILSTYVTGLGLPASEENGLTAKIGTAGQIVNDGNTNNDSAAINLLQSIINSIEAQRDKKIPAATADELINKAQKIIDLMRTG